MRDVVGRLAWFFSHKPDMDSDGKPDAGACANHVWRALDIPAAGFPDATAAWRRMEHDGHMNQGPAPKGAIHLWTGGSEGHGHAAYASDAWGGCGSVDVHGPGTVGIVSFPWFKQHWPTLRYRGWTWYWGAIDTQPKEDKVAKWPAVGSKKVIELDSVVLTPGKYTSVGKITLPDGEYLLTLQGRLPEGDYARVEFQRIGWGNDPDGRDQTGSTPWTPPDPKATSFSHTHPISGGGPVDYVIKSTGDSATAVVVKATRFA